MIEEVEGIIFSTVNYKESSIILNVITKKYGIIGILAKGAKRLKSPLRSYTDRLTYAKFQIVYKKDKLSLLNNVDNIDSFKNIKKNIKKITYALYLLELSTQVLKQSNDLVIYDLLISALTKIDEGYDEAVITNIIELKYLDYLGVMPILDSCYKCGNKEIITISDEGYLCKKCITNEKILNNKSLKLIQMFYYVDISKITNVDIKENIKKEIDDFLNSYYERYTGLYLNSKKLINNSKIMN